MDRARAVAIVGGGVVALAMIGRPARADLGACAALLRHPGPTVLGGEGGDLGQVTEACAGTSLSLRTRGAALIDRPDFYGAIDATATVRGRLRLASHWFAGAAFDLATVRYTANAVLASTASTVGPGTVSLHRSFAGERFAVAPYLRALVPIDTARRHGVMWGAELGVSAARTLGPRTTVLGGLAVPATLVVVSGIGHEAIAPRAVAELSVAVLPWLSVSGGAAARTRVVPSWIGQAVAARASVQAFTRRGWAWSLATELPFAGDDRTDLITALLVTWQPR